MQHKCRYYYCYNYGNMIFNQIWFSTTTILFIFASKLNNQTFTPDSSLCVLHISINHLLQDLFIFIYFFPFFNFFYFLISRFQLFLPDKNIYLTKAPYIRYVFGRNPTYTHIWPCHYCSIPNVKLRCSEIIHSFAWSI